MNKLARLLSIPEPVPTPRTDTGWPETFLMRDPNSPHPNPSHLYEIPLGAILEIYIGEPDGTMGWATRCLYMPARGLWVGSGELYYVLRNIKRGEGIEIVVFADPRIDNTTLHMTIPHSNIIRALIRIIRPPEECKKIGDRLRAQ